MGLWSRNLEKHPAENPPDLMPHAALLSIVVACLPALEAARKTVLVVGKPLCPIMVSPAVACVGAALVDCICAMLIRGSRRQADYTFKVGVVGAGNVGKSAFVTRLGGEEFVSTYSRATTGTVPCTHTGVAVGGPYGSDSTFVVRTSAGSFRVEMVEVSRREEDEGGIADDDDLYVGTSARCVRSWLLSRRAFCPALGWTECLSCSTARPGSPTSKSLHSIVTSCVCYIRSLSSFWGTSATSSSESTLPQRARACVCSCSCAW